MFLDTSNIEDINKCMKAGIFKGVTTNPTILLKENKSRMQQINDILNTEAQLLFIQIVGDTVEELYKDYELLKAIATDKKIGYKVSVDMVGLEVVKKIKEDNKDAIILGTAIYSAEQAILAALAGCDYVAPYVNRMENNNIDPLLRK